MDGVISVIHKVRFKHCKMFVFLFGACKSFGRWKPSCACVLPSNVRTWNDYAAYLLGFITLI
jgi:hypothetical protein